MFQPIFITSQQGVKMHKSSINVSFSFLLSFVKQVLQI